MDRAVTLRDMLAAREERAAVQQAMRARFGVPVMTYSLNVAGSIKRTGWLCRGFEQGLARIKAQLARHRLTILQESMQNAFTGDVWFGAVDADPMALKRLTCVIEEADALGRLMDVDVLNTAGEKVSRVEVGLMPRRCFLCGNEAHACARSRAHTVEALFAHAEQIARDAVHGALADHLAALAQRALLYELATSPKPGLVDRLGNGAHRDMDFFTFLDSISALTPYFRECVLLGLRQPEARLLAALRYQGQCAEAAMYKATGQVNTHKGAIFSLGLLCGSAGLLCRDAAWPDIKAMCTVCGTLATPLLEELGACQADETAGMRLFRQMGASGARGEAASGFSSVQAYALPALGHALSRGWTLEQAGLMALLSLMAVVEDTNLLARGGEARRKAIAEHVKTLLDAPSPPLDALAALDAQLTAWGISPGGCADLLAVTYFLHFIACEAPPVE